MFSASFPAPALPPPASADATSEALASSGLGGALNWNLTTTARSFSAFPALMMKGTPAQRSLSMNSATDANVGVLESRGTPGSSVYPSGSEAEASYWPRTTSSSLGGATQRRSLTFSSRTSSAARDTGCSIVRRARTFFCF